MIMRLDMGWSSRFQGVVASPAKIGRGRNGPYLGQDAPATIAADAIGLRKVHGRAFDVRQTERVLRAVTGDNLRL